MTFKTVFNLGDGGVNPIDDRRSAQANNDWELPSRKNSITGSRQMRNSRSVVLAMAPCPSVKSQYCVETTGRIELIFVVELLPLTIYTVLGRNSSISKIRALSIETLYQTLNWNCKVSLRQICRQRRSPVSQSCGVKNPITVCVNTRRLVFDAVLMVAYSTWYSGQPSHNSRHTTSTPQNFAQLENFRAVDVVLPKSKQTNESSNTGKCRNNGKW